MNTMAFGAGIRTIALAAVLALAAAVGLAFGNLVNQRDGSTNAGYPVGWQPGAAAPAAVTAQAVFSAAALDAVRVTRGDIAALPAQPELSDYHDRHPVEPKPRTILTDPKIR